VLAQVPEPGPELATRPVAVAVSWQAAAQTAEPVVSSHIQQ